MMKKIALTLLSIACLASFSFAKDKAPKAQKIAGWLADEKCARKDKGASETHADCTKKCVGAGEKLVLVADKEKTILNIDNQDAVKDHASHHVTLTGKVNGDTIHVDKVTMLKQPKPAAQKGEHGTGI